MTVEDALKNESVMMGGECRHIASNVLVDPEGVTEPVLVLLYELVSHGTVLNGKVLRQVRVATWAGDRAMFSAIAGTRWEAAG